MTGPREAQASPAFIAALAADEGLRNDLASLVAALSDAARLGDELLAASCKLALLELADRHPEIGRDIILAVESYHPWIRPPDPPPINRLPA